MPWNPDDATRHTKKANTPAKKKKWAKTATGLLKEGYSDASAIRIANSAIAKAERKLKGK